MRRAEMVKAIQIFLTQGPDADGEKVLEFIEKMGMKPPSLPEIYRRGLTSLYYAGYTYNQWEENAEKDEKLMAWINARKNNGR